jgi:hypothetical protein
MSDNKQFMSISLQFFDQRESKTLSFARNSLDFSINSPSFAYQFLIICSLNHNHLLVGWKKYAHQKPKIRSLIVVFPFIIF